MPLKKCNRCKIDKATTDFYANKRMKDGLNTFCILCHKADNVARKLKNRQNTAFKQQEQAYKKQYRTQKKNQIAQYMQGYRKEHKERLLESGRAYRRNHSAKYAYLCQARKLAIIQRTPLWVGEDEKWLIREAYELAHLRDKIVGGKWHVDHIVPLRGKHVSGLHVIENLRVVTAHENMRKTNKFEV